MFNLIMLNIDWTSGRGSIPIDRIFAYTEDGLRDEFKSDNRPNIDKLRELPCLFMEEGTDDEVAYVGQIIHARFAGHDVQFEYALDREVPPLKNSTIYANRAALDMNDARSFEFSRNHWAIKDVDLYRFLLRNVRPRRQRPIVFQIPEHENIEPTLVSAMMPFEAGFDIIYDSIRQAAANVGLRCRRADDIWENPAVIQDVIALIDRSRIIICDCSGRNPNVFYETGIAHTLGREVILITRNEQDIPFDLRHLRYIRYDNNGEGCSILTQTLQTRMQTVLGH